MSAPRRNIMLGTAGHVDHGKTTLVKALTGIDTDRLPEEKRRGITLELGFAHLALPSGRAVGVIDVPGHERFVRAMAAGAGGVDVALLVVAADEGVMPQTREHVDICRLLGVRRGVLVVTKADLLPGLGEGWLELLEGELRAVVGGTFLEGAPLLPVSARSGEGLEALKVEVDGLLQALEAEGAGPRSPDGPLFVPLDRAFTTRGFGLVATGTLLSGKVRPGDEVTLLPGLDGPYRVRGVQVHGASVEEARAGARVALNLPDLDTAQVHRGMAVVRHGELSAARALDVEVTLLPSVDAPLGRRTRPLVCLGTEHVEAVLRLLDVDALRPGETCFAQLRFSGGVAALPGQRFILRGTHVLQGRGATVGGGRVLAVNPPRRRRGAAERLQAFAAAPLDARVRSLVAEAGHGGLTEAELFARASASARELHRAVEVLASKGALALVDKEQRRYLDAGVLEALRQRALARLDRFHREFPEREGLGREELRQRLEVPHERTFQRVLAELQAAHGVEVAGELVHLKGRGRAFDDETRTLKTAALAALAKAPLAPPTVSELGLALHTPDARMAELLQTLVAEGGAVKAGELFFDAAAVEALGERLVAHLEAHRAITTQAFKELVGQSRKYVIPLAEYFDREKVTMRVGEERVLRRKG
jgi:selenocysteine-specific elongation factor